MSPSIIVNNPYMILLSSQYRTLPQISVICNIRNGSSTNFVFCTSVIDLYGRSYGHEYSVLAAIVGPKFAVLVFSLVHYTHFQVILTWWYVWLYHNEVSLEDKISHKVFDRTNVFSHSSNRDKFFFLFTLLFL